MAECLSIAPREVNTAKVKVTPDRPRRPRGGVDIKLYSFCLTSALGGLGGQRHAPAALPPGKTRYHRRLGGPQGRSGRERKSRHHRDSIPRPSSP
jgi:hypothetical protein